ncbi:MAG TPA: hypothetical protein VGO43_07915 [Pyrinomonadaceae bacterium]|jgi:hypothetical protein|nr:hypothetical protein [Pyrinomonadaceae bacterium]
MNYCLDCGVRLDSEPETLIRDLTPAQPTFVGHVRPQPKGKAWIPVGVLSTLGVALLTVFGVFLFTTQGTKRAAPDAQSINTSIESIQQAGANEVTRAVAKPAPTVPIKAIAALKPSTPIAIKYQPMQTRIEIINGVDHCYAIPGGDEIPCQ